MATKKSDKSADANKSSQVFTDEEREAMKERVKEQKATSRRGAKREDGEKDVLEKLADLSEPDRSMGERIHEIVMASAPDLMPRTWYGMPAYEKDGEIICFFQPATKFKARYATLGFNDSANLDAGSMFPTSFGVKKLTATAEKEIRQLVKKAVS